MKKFLALLGVFSTLFAFAACNDDKKAEVVTATDENGSVYTVKATMSPEELEALSASRQANIEKESRLEQESIKQELEIQSEKQNTLKSLGKTEKGKQIVFTGTDHQAGMKEVFEIIKFGKDGKFESWIRYTYYPKTETFNRALADMKTEKNFAYETSDASDRVIVHRLSNKNMIEDLKRQSYDTVFKNIKDFGYKIVE